ncbi:hypothetical protein H310_01683 [Aphanomyces invadans]|uniref:GAF domain-containing protein n=1 Tax=Aphanomyces invadans TaxID=157072 RepID=A0A024US29_9STRA|nr:hypothetical protein H310_01683 [Aphanomyces invadans]ETW09291.1 hypothetical protein H310_01683 [Aphanomyces invadans]|eukprot:XP_008863096.1 hypothetical protein H310_01683 [Aphanomyces invadans]
MSNLSAVPTQHQIDSDEDDEEVYGSMQSSVLGGSSSMDSSNPSSITSSSSHMGSFQNNLSSSRLASLSGVIDEADEVQYHRSRGSNEHPRPPRPDGSGFIPLTTLSASTQLTQVKQFSYPLHYTDGQLWPLAPIPTEEPARLRKLDDLSILDTPQEQEYNHIAQGAADALQASFGFISFIDAKREWVKASYGNGAGANTSVSRDVSISAHVIMSYEVTVVPNLTTDVRFRDNPLVLDGIKLRSFVGYPLVTSDGFIVGVLGAADTRILSPARMVKFVMFGPLCMTLFECVCDR